MIRRFTLTDLLAVAFAAAVLGVWFASGSL